MIIEWRHPVAALAVLYWVSIMLVSFLTRLTFHTQSLPRGGIDDLIAFELVLFLATR